MTISEAELGPVTGHDEAIATWRRSLASGRHHHAWILQGPRGVGKSRLALQLAGNLLGGDRATVTPDHPTGRLMLAGSHPDFRILRRVADDKGKLRRDIPIDDVRELIAFLGLRPALNGWRVAIIDALDELNRNGLNALLKTIEEPPGRTALILISHGEAPMLATIKSRCSILRCHALTEDQQMTVLSSHGLDEKAQAALYLLAPGRPGRALAMNSEDTLEAAEAIRAGLKSLPTLSSSMISEIIHKVGKSDATFSAAMSVVAQSLHKRASREANPERAADWASLALSTTKLEQEAVALSMDRGQAALMALRRISKLATAAAGRA